MLLVTALLFLVCQIQISAVKKTCNTGHFCTVVLVVMVIWLVRSTCRVIIAIADLYIFKLFSLVRNISPPCFSPCCGEASLGSSGSESIAVHDRLPGRWSAICWRIWSVRLKTNTGSAGLSWLWSRSTVTPQSAEPRTGSRSRRPNFPISLNTNTWQITWVISKSPRRGQVNVSRETASKDCLYNVTI